MQQIIKVEVSEPCWKCDGPGGNEQPKPCNVCDGSEIIPTEFGQDILRLIEYRVREIVREELQKSGVKLG